MKQPIMQDNMPHINLWECLTSLHNLPASHSVTDELLQALGFSTRFHMQELTLMVTDDGWLIQVFSADSGLDPGKIEILIPKDYTKPVKVLEDTAGRIKHLHD